MARKKNDENSEPIGMPEVTESEFDASAAAPEYIADETSNTAEGIGDLDASAVSEGMAEDKPPEMAEEPPPETLFESFAEMCAELTGSAPPKPPTENAADESSIIGYEPPDNPPDETPTPEQATGIGV